MGQKYYFECLLSLKENDTNKYNYTLINKCPCKLKLSEINFYIRPIYSSLIISQDEFNIYIKYSESTLANKVFSIFMNHQSPMKYQIKLQKRNGDKMNNINEFNINENNYINNIKK